MDARRCGSFFRAFLATVLFLVAYLPAGAFDFQHSKTKELAALIAESLNAQRAKGTSRPAFRILEIQRAYGALPRAEVPLDELRELKFAMQHWLTMTHRYLATLGDKTGLMTEAVGPTRTLPIAPVFGSAWPYERWAVGGDFALEKYDYEGDGVVNFRGIPFRSGDLVAIDQNVASGDGNFTSLLEEPRLASHTGLFVILERGGRRYPSVLDVHEKGLRAVPLSIYVHPNFANHIEVLRPKVVPPGWTELIETASARFLGEPHAYDLWTLEEDPRYVTCTVAPLHLYRQTGASVPIHRGTVSRGLLKENLELLGFKADKFLVATDYLRDPGFSWVGMFSAMRIEQTVINDIFSSHMGYTLRRKKFDPSKFPWMYHVNRWALRQMGSSWNPIGWAFRSAFGFTSENFPTGPANMIALYKEWEGRLEKGGKWLREVSRCPQMLECGANGLACAPGIFSISAFENDPAVRAEVDKGFEPIRHWFHPE